MSNIKTFFPITVSKWKKQTKTFRWFLTLKIDIESHVWILFFTNSLKFSGSQSKKDNYELIFEQKSTPSWNWSSQLPHHTGHAIVHVNQMKFKNCLRFRFTLIDRVPLWICPPWLWQTMEATIGKFWAR